MTRPATNPQKTKLPRGAKKHPAVGCDEAGEDHFARVFAALGESTRLRIMQMLPREPRCDQMYNVVELA